MLPDWIILHRWLANRGKSVGVASGLMWLTLHAHTPIIARHACIHHHARTHMHTPCSNIVGCLRTHIKGVLSLSLECKVARKNLNGRLFHQMRSQNQIWSNALFFFSWENIAMDYKCNVRRFKKIIKLETYEVNFQEVIQIVFKQNIP